MIRLSLLLYYVLICNMFLFATSNSSIHTFLLSIKPELHPLQISLKRGHVHVEVEELNYLFQENDVINIEPWLTSAREEDRDGDIYLNRIYRVYVDRNSSKDINQIISSIKSSPYILNVKRESIRKVYALPNDKYFILGDQCSIEDIRADLAWGYWYENSEIPGDEDILYVSVDTGVDYMHPDLLDNIWINQGEIQGNVSIQGFINSGAIEISENGYVSARSIDTFISNNNFGDLNADGVKNIKDALDVHSWFCDGVDNDGNGKIDDLIGWDMGGYTGSGDNDPYPKEGVLNELNGWHHGTHVAGVLCASTNNNIGMAATSYAGKIMSIKCAIDTESEDDPSIHGGYDGILYAAQMGHSVGMRTIINCSWGGSGYNEYEQSVINVAYNNYGAIIVAAAGNGIEGSNEEEYAPHYPSSYDNVLSISPVKCGGEWGKWATYHPTVDLAAPGEGIFSTLINANGTVRYGELTGSSMASPNAASAIGLIWSFYDDWSNNQVINQVLSTADPMIMRRVYWGITKNIKIVMATKEAIV